jgi:2-haloacid dehalogenase
MLAGTLLEQAEESGNRRGGCRAKPGQQPAGGASHILGGAIQGPGQDRTSGPLAWAYEERRTKALLLDAFPIFEPRPVFALAEEVFPGKGSELAGLWRSRQFEYTWLRAVAHRYEDFWKVTEDALVFAARSLKLDLDRTGRERLMEAYLKLRAYPDVVPALKSLKGAGIRLGVLSNLTPKMLDSAIAGSGLGDLFEHVLSTDKLKTYKPDPRAYQMGTDAFGLERVFMATRW